MADYESFPRKPTKEDREGWQAVKSLAKWALIALAIATVIRWAMA